MFNMSLSERFYNNVLCVPVKWRIFMPILLKRGWKHVADIKSTLGRFVYYYFINNAGIAQ